MLKIFILGVLVTALSLSIFYHEPTISLDPILLAGKYYRVLLPRIEADMAKIIESAKQAGFSVRIARGLHCDVLSWDAAMSGLHPGERTRTS
jgi:hypothetical protein